MNVMQRPKITAKDSHAAINCKIKAMNNAFLLSDRFLHENITNFTIEITQQCNCSCSYCCYSGEYRGMRKHTNISIGEDTMLKAIEFIKNHAHKTEDIVVSFWGGEALLYLDKIINIAEGLQQIFGERILFDISTNGLLLKPETIKKMMPYNMGISVSLDGCKTIHDKNRRTIAGVGTYDQIVKNLKKFKALYPDEYRKRIRLLITAGTIDDIVVMNDNFSRFRELLGDKPLFISRIIPNFSKGELYENDIETEKQILNQAIERKRKGIVDLYTLILDQLLKKAQKKFTSRGSDSKIHLRTCMDNMYSVFIDTQGRLYPCEKFDTSHSIGDLDSGISEKLVYKWAAIYTFRRSMLCGDCQKVEYCTRCLADLKMSFSEQKQMCAEYRKNIELARLYNEKLNNNA